MSTCVGNSILRITYRIFKERREKYSLYVHLCASLLPCPVCGEKFDESVIESHAAVCGEIVEIKSEVRPEENDKESDDVNFDVCAFSTNSESVDDKPSCSPSEHVSKCVLKTLKEMKGIEKSKLILNSYIENFFDGDIDMMEQVDASSSKEIIRFGVVVDRQNIFEDIFSEMGREDDLKYPLEVTFMGEEAVDYGGPRREFLTLAMHSIKEKLFTKGELVNEDVIGKENYMMFLKERKFEIAGTVAGLSLLEGGPIPRLFTNFEEIIRNEGCNDEERDFLKGLKRIGIFQLCREKQELCSLFNEVEPVPITYGYLTKLFKPQFSEEGSNTYLAEKKMYRNFLDYLKEVAAHRRGSVALEDVLRFVTGIEVQPLLGFRHQPSISFIDGESYLATSSTCTCTLYLPGKIGDQEKIFKMFDYSFSNTYFGKA